jgi:hypothetical protein
LDLVKSPKYMERFHVVSLRKGIGEHFSKWKHLLLSMVPRTPCIINFATTGDGVLEGWSRWQELQNGGDGSDGDGRYATSARWRDAWRRSQWASRIDYLRSDMKTERRKPPRKDTIYRMVRRKQCPGCREGATVQRRGDWSLAMMGCYEFDMS